MPRKKLNNNDRVKKIEAHVEILNKEVGQVVTEIATTKNDIKWIVDKIDKIDSRTWFIITGILISIGITIVGFLI